MRIRHQKKACKKCNRFLRYLGFFKRPETKCPCGADVGFFDVPTGLSEVVTLPRVRRCQPGQPVRPTNSFKVKCNHQEVGVYEDFDEAVAARKLARKQHRMSKNPDILTFNV